jgi:hypothetical protein
LRISEPGTVGKILNAKISLLPLDRNEQYDPNQAIDAILNSADVRLAMSKLNARPALASGHLGSIPWKGQPHLQSAIKSATVGQSLDRILYLFGGLIVYSECTRPDGEQLFSIAHYRK